MVVEAVSGAVLLAIQTMGSTVRYEFQDGTPALEFTAFCGGPDRDAAGTFASDLATILTETKNFDGARMPKQDDRIFRIRRNGPGQDDFDVLDAYRVVKGEADPMCYRYVRESVRSAIRIYVRLANRK